MYVYSIPEKENMLEVKLDGIKKRTSFEVLLILNWSEKISPAPSPSGIFQRPVQPYNRYLPP